MSTSDTLSKLRSSYSETEETFNCLLLGDAGSGKTFSLRTARKPVLILQFDPGGAVSVREEIKKGEIIVRDYSTEDPSNPTAFQDFVKEVNEFHKEGLFNEIGTVVLDSLTSFSDSVLLAILHANGRGMKEDKVNLNHASGQKVAIPELRDYQYLMQLVEKIIRKLTSTPCDFICIAHLNKIKDEVSGRMISAPLLTGKMAIKIPTLFDEIYIAETEVTSKGPQYHFLTQPSGIHKPRSRMAGEGRLLAKEEPNFKAILKKCGLPTEDLPLLLSE